MDKKGNSEMSTILGKPFSLDWRGNPPHMLQPDIPVWYRFLEMYGSMFKNLWYDVLLGADHLTTDQEKDPMLIMKRSLMARRADAIVELENEVWIIEVSDDPGLRAVGQIMSYLVLWSRDPVILKPEQMILVCSTIEPNLLDATTSYGIRVYII